MMMVPIKGGGRDPITEEGTISNGSHKGQRVNEYVVLYACILRTHLVHFISNRKWLPNPGGCHNS